jgi:hypothetical protein
MVVTAVGIGPDFDSSFLVVSAVESNMRRLLLFAGLFVYGLIVVPGCSQSPSEPIKIDGMSPAEYREKAEPTQAIPAKKQKTGGARG